HDRSIRGSRRRRLPPTAVGRRLLGAVLRRRCEAILLAGIDDGLHPLAAALDLAAVLVQVDDDAVTDDLVRTVVHHRRLGEDEGPVPLLEHGATAGCPAGPVVDAD